MDFLESSFFKVNGQNQSLPTPSEVRALSGPKEKTQPLPVRFEHLNLLVKFGRLGDDIPVPEVYGWRIDGDDVFIYMELIHGDTLKSRWDSMSRAGKETAPSESFVGSLDGHHLTDYVLESFPPRGPFPNTQQFNDWFASLAWSRFPNPESIQDPWRVSPPDTVSIKLTHGDLHRCNILITSTSPPRVLAIVDWAHGGWYPDWWEYCKASYTCSSEGEWRNTWIPMFLEPQIEVDEIFGEYIHAMGAF
ncbi:phosphotransferase enzyme family protein [Leptodontidium sp. 2 PMI_412]|nr:phosphotransferase enzyme family protein [Leptodontidium sp. 2 PMI_412]